MKFKFAPLLVDGYKTGHKDQYPKNARVVFSNKTPRGSRIAGVDEVIFFGLQYFIKEYIIKNWNESFFSQPIEDVVKKYSRILNSYLGPNQIGDQHIRDLHALGYLPLEFWALPEGSAVPLRVPTYVVFNTCPEVMPEAVFAWVTNSIETIASTSLWMPTTSATTAKQYCELLTRFAKLTNPEMESFVPWQGHDFSFRGHSSCESAVLSAAGHLVFFTGTDTVPALMFMEEYYNADIERELVGGSVPATEHSVMCMGGLEDEVETFRRLIEDIYPSGIVSIVSDTWDFWNVVDPENGICVKLKDKIVARDGKVVIRPDSGDPVKIITGYMHEELNVDINGNYYDRNTGKELCDNEVKGMITCLYEIFGGTQTSTGYIQLDSHIGAIYGDSITMERATQICERLQRKGFASTNLVYGIGSYTYQYVTRDTYGFAVKSTYGEVLGDDGKLVGVEIFKDPKTDDGLKKSAKGLTAVFMGEDGKYFLKDQATWDEVKNCAFHKVFSNGVLTTDWSLDEIRKTAAKTLRK
jgi:nicotinamide phosphoribosyltransferase